MSRWSTGAFFEFECSRTFGNVSRRGASAATLRQAFKDIVPDLVILDLKLPDGDGLDLLPEMKKKWPRSKTIILIGYGTVDAAERAYLVDEVYIQCKPFDAGILRALVNVALHSKRPSPSPHQD